MTATNKLELELLQNAAANQTLANITFALLNQLVQAGVVDKDLAAPPSSPADEALYIVGASATDAWAGRDGQLAYWLVTAGAWQFITPKEGFFLHVNDEDVFYKFTGTAWEVFSGGGGGGGMTNPMTAIRDLIVGGVGGAPTRLPGPTSEGLVLTRIGNALAWAIATGFANPMTAGGDLIIGGTNGAATKLGAGTAGQVLTMVAGAPAWVTPSGGGGGGDFKADGSVPMTGALNEAPPVELGPTSAYRLPVASAAAKSNTIKVIAGAVSFFNSMDFLPLGSRRQLVFTVPMTMVNTSGLILLTGDSIDAVPGDTAQFLMLSESVWKMERFDKFDGTPLKSNAVTSVAGRTGTVTLAKSDVGLANADNTADADKPVSAATLTALNERVSVAGDQFITGKKTLTNQLVIQSGAGSGSIVVGADVNNNTITNGIRKLARIVVPPYTGSLPNWTLLAGDTTDVSGVNEVYFGGAPGSSIGGATSIHFYTAPSQAAGAGLRRWSVGSDGNLLPGLASVYDLGSSATPIRSLYAGGPVKIGSYTLATLPSASGYSGCIIDVTNASGGPKTCRSNGTVWQILNTLTTVS
jgi:hypothetical protein